LKEKCAAVKEEMDVTLEILDYRSLIALQGLKYSSQSNSRKHG
jgi:hypothetical protein